MKESLLDFLELKIKLYEQEHRKYPMGQKGHDLELIANEVQKIVNTFKEKQKTLINYEEAWNLLKDWLKQLLGYSTIAGSSVIRKMNEIESTIKVIIERRRCVRCLLTKPDIFVLVDGKYVCHSCYRNGK